MKNTKLKNLIISLLVAVLSYVVYKIIPCKQIAAALNLGNQATSLLTEVVMFLCFFIGAVILKKTYVLKLKGTGFGIGCLLFIFPLLTCYTTIQTMMQNYETYGSIMTIPVSELLMFILLNVLIGMAEELLFRGIIQNSLHEFFGEGSQGAIRAAILIQAVLFGSMHFINLLSPAATFDGVLVQVIINLGMGALLGTIYYRSGKNLWVVIILHAINDFRALVDTGALTGASDSDNLAAYGSDGSQAFFAGFLFCAIYLVFAFVGTRKKALAKFYVKEDGQTS